MGKTTKLNIKGLQVQQNKKIKTFYNLDKRTPTEEIFINKLTEHNIKPWIISKNINLIHKIKNQLIKINTALQKNRETNINYSTKRKSQIRPEKYRMYDKKTLDSLTGMVRRYNNIDKKIKTFNFNEFKIRIKQLIWKEKYVQL